MGAAHRSAARAWGARPVPFRTRKLSPIAPRVLRGQPVGGQGAADRWTAPSRTLDLKKGEASRPPPFLRLRATFLLQLNQFNHPPLNIDVHRSLVGSLFSMD